MSSMARVISEGSQIVDYFEEERESIEKQRIKALSKEKVDPEIFKKGLYCLGKTTNNVSFAYLALNISENDLSSITGIENFRFLQTVNLSNNNLINLKCLSSLKHLVRLNASNNSIRKMFDFDPPANLESVDYSNNCIEYMTNIDKHRYLKNLILDNNNISQIQGLTNNKFLRMLSLNNNNIDIIENLGGLSLEELFLADNNIKVINGLDELPLLRRLDLSKNNISRLKGLEEIIRLKFLFLCHNYISKISELEMIENLQELTELDLCFNPLQNRKYYRFQVLFKIPQLRALDGVEISCEEKIKAENLHGLDLKDRETIFKSLFPEENYSRDTTVKFVDRRINKIEDIEPESESDPENVEFMDHYEDKNSQLSLVEMSSVASRTMNEIVSKRGSMASMGSRMSSQRANLKSHGNSADYPMGASLTNFTKNYVGELLDKAAFQGGYGDI